MTFRVLVCGGRDFTAEWEVFRALEIVWEEHDHQLVVIEGGARGADRAAALWATGWKDNNVEHVQFKAKWRVYGKNAGPLRNQRMLDEGKPDLVLAFPGGSGTADMVKRAKTAGVEVRQWP